MWLVLVSRMCWSSVVAVVAAGHSGPVVALVVI